MEIVESTEHILLHCPAYALIRAKMIHLCLNIQDQQSKQLVTRVLQSKSAKNIMQFLLDPSTVPEVIELAQVHGEEVYNGFFYLGRSWCFALHREWMKRHGRWNFR